MTMKNKGVLGFLGYGTGSFEPFDQSFVRGHHVKTAKLAHSDNNFQLLKDELKANCDALVIWGGADISPSLYGETVAPETGADEEPDRQDMDEARACLAAIELGIPLIGVCRGAQLLCALAGGKLVQHVSNHTISHNIITCDGEVMKTSSLHHQMMWPWQTKHRLLAWSEQKRSNIYVFNAEHRTDSTSFVEPEVVYFPDIKGLAIQGHPEFMASTCEFVEYCNRLVREFTHTAMVEKTTIL